MNSLWAGIKVAIAVLTGFWLGLPGAIKAMMLLQIIDIASGMMAASQEDEPNNRLSSRVAARGMRRKGLAWAVVGVVLILQTFLAVEMQVSLFGFTPAEGVAGYFAISEALSIVENAEKLGVPIPAFISKALAQQYKKYEAIEGDSK